MPTRIEHVPDIGSHLLEPWMIDLQDALSTVADDEFDFIIALVSQEARKRERLSTH